jgi:hypothetical protein
MSHDPAAFAQGIRICKALPDAVMIVSITGRWKPAL